jgi:predicted nucleic acid-binding Zn ribbon protein
MKKKASSSKCSEILSKERNILACENEMILLDVRIEIEKLSPILKKL